MAIWSSLQNLFSRRDSVGQITQLHLRSLPPFRLESPLLSTWSLPSPHQTPASVLYSTFKPEFSHLFGHPVRGAEAAAGLLSLQQEAVTVADYSIQF